jgi:hypothetical protein
MWQTRVRLLVAALWAGSLWTVGYLVAPTLFATLNDNVLAGSIAGSMFRNEAWLTLVCGAVLLWLMPERRKLVLAMLACTLIGYFGLHPFLAEAKLAGDKATFGLLHGAASLIYLTQSVLALVLVGWAPRAHQTPV